MLHVEESIPLNHGEASTVLVPSFCSTRSRITRLSVYEDSLTT